MIVMEGWGMSMGIADSFMDKAADVVDKVGAERVKDGIEMAGDKLDDATGDKYAGMVDKAQDAASALVDKADADGQGQ